MKDAMTQQLAQLHCHADDPGTSWDICTYSHKPCFGVPRSKKGRPAQNNPSQHLISRNNNFTDHLLENSEILTEVSVSGNE